MKIAVIAWGSLVWDPKNLNFDGNWRTDGPQLPVEFARKSQGGRLTLVIYEPASPVTTLWTLSTEPDVRSARENLRKREGTHDIDIIGYWSRSEGTNYRNLPPNYHHSLAEWCNSKALDAAIWTALGSNFESLTVESACAHLQELSADKKSKAFEYIRKTPEQIQTDFRSRLEAVE